MSPHTKIDTLIVSDLHLGSLVSRAKELTDFLSTHSYRRLILLGDIFESSRFERLNQEDWDFLAFLRRLSDPGNNCELIWIRGNHDKDFAHTMSRIIGTHVLDEYVWEHKKKRFLALHGDQFDTFIQGNVSANRMFGQIFLFLQWFDRDSKHVVRFIESVNDFIRRLSHRVSTGAIAYAENVQAEYVFCGHTHIPMQITHNADNGRINYYNVGSWTRSPSTFAAIDDSGNIIFEKYATAR
jgi:UDP-2,3-diacylglucosamine pyrophosphatase LpxH